MRPFYGKRLYTLFGARDVLPPAPPPVDPPTVSTPVSIAPTSPDHIATLTVTPGAYANSTGATKVLSWYRDGTLIVGQSGTTLALAEADIGKVFKVRETVTTTAGSVYSEASTAAVSRHLYPPSATSPPVISGVTNDGETLSTSNGSWNNGGGTLTYSYQWTRDGSPISGATSATYLLALADVGKNVNCTVTATNTVGSASQDATAVGPIAEAPAAPSVVSNPVTSGSPTTGTTLGCSSGSWDSHAGGTITYAYQWQADGSNISGATANSYVVLMADVGKTIRCVVTATNSQGSTSQATAGIGPVTETPAAPENTALPAITGTPNVGQTLSVSNGTWNSHNGGTLSYAYQWRRDGVSISGATSSTYALVSADVGAAISCYVAATNSAGTTTATAAATAAVTGAPTNSVAPAITGTPKVGSVLSASNGTWATNGGGTITYAYQWKRAGANIAGATAATYTAVSGDVGSALTCTVTATNSVGSANATSGATAAVANVPSNTAAPAITGTTQVASVLSCSTGTWNTNSGGTLSYAYQWKRDGTNIAGATSATYTLVTGDLGANVSCAVTATNSAGSTTASAAAVGPITEQPGPPTNTVAPSITGTTTSGQVLTCSTGTWDTHNGGTLSYGYVWKRDGVAITGATSSTYTLADADVDTNTTCTVTATNSVSGVAATSAAVGPILDGDAAAYFTALPGTAPSTAFKTAVNKFFKAIKATIDSTPNAIWAKTAHLNLFGVNEDANTVRNLRFPSQSPQPTHDATNLSHTAYRGLVGNGTHPSRFNVNKAPASNCAAFTNVHHTLAVYPFATLPLSAAAIAVATGSGISFQPRLTSPGNERAYTGGGTTNVGNPNDGAAGKLYGFKRTGGSSVQLCVGKTKVTSASAGTASAGTASQWNSAATCFFEDQASNSGSAAHSLFLGFIGAGLTDNEWDAFCDACDALYASVTAL